MDAYFYLLKGSVETRQPQRQWRARSFGRLRHFYPGCKAVRTLGNTQVLRVDAAHREFVLRGATLPASSASASALTSSAAFSAGTEPWLQRFLNSHMMQQLSPGQWQQLVAAFQAYDFAADRQILVRGQPGNHCYVLESGHALVQRSGETLGHLCPGDFFGEDALVLCSARNADVTALEPVRVRAIAQDVFAKVLLDNVVEFVSYAGCGQCLRLGEADSSEIFTLANLRQRSKWLDPRTTYYVRGGSRRERALAALLIVQRGIRAHPVED